MNTTLVHLSDSILLDEIKRLARCEREATAALVAHLAEMEARKLFCAEGCSSLFMYCTQILFLSENAAYRRVEAARMARQFPSILNALGNGDLHLTAIRLLSPYLTAENCDELVTATRHRSKREIEAFLAQRFPRKDVPTVIRKLPSPAPRVAGDMQERVAGERHEGVTSDGQKMKNAPQLSENDPDLLSPRTTSLEMIESQRMSLIAPLAPERYKVQFTASATMHDKLRRAQDLLRHRIPNGDLAEIFDLALTVLVEKVEKEKLAATDRPRSARRPATNSRTIPAKVKRAVWKRDGGRCGFIGKNDRRCPETGRLEFHHLVPFACGGQATIANIALRCRAHNQYEALLDFGPRDLPIVREASASWAAGGRDVPGASWAVVECGVPGASWAVGECVVQGASWAVGGRDVPGASWAVGECDVQGASLRG